MKYIQAKQILGKTKNQGWFGTDFTLNLYRGCSHGCIYCDSRSDCYHVEDFDTVKVKASALELLDKELSAKRQKGIVGMGAMSDPYNPLEKELGLTAKAIELIGQRGFGLTVTTKSALITRDIDRLKAVAKYTPVLCKVTLTTLNQGLAEKIEPRVSTPEERLRAIASLSEAGLKVGVLLMPVLPFLTDEPESIEALVKAVKSAGAHFVYPGMGVTLRDSQRDYFYEAIDKEFPGLKASYIREFGNQYSCGASQAKRLYQQFSKQCEQLGLLYHMKDIIQCYKQPYDQTQLSFFDT